MTSGNKYRTLFISDLHLGSPHCKAQRLYTFLNKISADRIYLIGDVLDHHTYLKGWPKLHNEILMKLAGFTSTGTQIIYIPGNHDDIFRHHVGMYGNLVIALKWVHISKDGRKFLITHGDETDMLGIGWLLAFLVLIERLTLISLWEMLRSFFSSAIKKHTIKFQRKMIKSAYSYSGVICGHVHYPKMGNFYMNTGDWMHHCTAIVEHHSGKFELLKG